MAKMGGARVFFTVLANAQVDNLISDIRGANAIMESVFLDSIEGITEGMDEMFQAWTAWSDAMVDSAMEVEMAKISFEKFFDAGIEQAKELEEQLIATGLAFGSTAEASIRAGAQMMQIEAGVLGGKEPAVAATKGAMLMGAVGMMDTDAAMKSIMQLQMQTNFMYTGAENMALSAASAETKRAVVLGNTVRLVDMLNEAENRTGATIQTITFSMNQFAASAKLANMSIEEQISLSAALIEKGEEQGKAGRAIKMMLARLASNRSNNNDLLKEHGVLVVSATGEMKGLTEIMADLKNKTDAQGRSWDYLTAVEKQNIAIAVAGSHHYVRFLKLMDGYNRVIDIQETLSRSAGSAMKEYSTFLKSAAFELKVYTNALEAEAAVTGNLLIPSKVQAMKAELMFAEARNKVLGTTMGARGSMWAEMANVGFQHAKGIMQAIFMYRVFKVAMQTFAIVQGQVAQRTNITTKARMDAINAEKMGTAVRREAFALHMQGLKPAQVQAQMGYSQIQIDHAINEGMVAKAKLISHNHISMAKAQTNEVKGDKNLTAAKMKIIRAGYILGAQNQHDLEQQIAIRKVKMLKTQEELLFFDVTSKMSGTKTLMERQELNIKGALLRATVALNGTEIAGMENKIALSNAMNNIAAGGLSYKKQEMFINTISAENDATQAQIKLLLADAKVVNIKLDQTAIATGLANIKLSGGIAVANLNQAKTSAIVNHENKKRILTGGVMTSSLMLSSMVLMMFTDNEVAATAAMYLMSASMIPMTLSMLSYGAAADKAALSTTIATLGFAAVAGVAAYMLARATAGTSKFAKEQEKMQKEMEDSQQEMELMSDEMEKYANDSDMAIQALTDNTVDNLETMGDAMNSFDNKRQEIFYGGRAGRMDSALFREIRLNGVEKLYFAPEVSMTNNFNGLTYDKATELIAEKVLGKLELLVTGNSMDIQNSSV